MIDLVIKVKLIEILIENLKIIYLKYIKYLNMNYDFYFCLVRVNN